MADFELAVPGVIYIGSTGRQKEEASEGTPHVVHLGASAGWMKPRGIRQWTREVSVIRRSAFGDSVRKELGATLPQEQVAAARMPLASRAARESPFIAVSRNLVEKLVEKGVRVHTVGFDKVTGGFYYLAEGGQSPPARIEGDVIEMVSPALEAAGDNADLDSLLEGVIDRILLDVSKGDISESAVELAAALPRLCTDGRGTQDCDLESFEREAASLVGRSAQFETLARVLASRLSSTKHSDVVTVPLFGEARREKEPVITVNFGSNHTQLSARDRWLVAGAPNREITLAPQRANTVRVPTVQSPPASGNGEGRIASRGPTPRPAAGIAAAPMSENPATAITASPSPVAASPSPGSSATAAPIARARPVVPTPSPASSRLAGAIATRTALPRPAASQGMPGLGERKAAPPEPSPLPPPIALEDPFAPFPEPVLQTAPETPDMPAVPDSIPAPELPESDLEDRISFPGPADSLPVMHGDPESDAPAPAAAAIPSVPEPLFAAAHEPVMREAPQPESYDDVPASKPLPSPIFAPPAHLGPRRNEVEPEPMTQPSQRRKREMEEAQARAVRDARRLALWLVIGVILILVAVYVIWSMRR